METTNPHIEVTYVGLDIAKERLDYTVDGERFGETTNDAKGHARLVARLRQIKTTVRVVCEATGGYERAVVAALSLAAIEVCMVNPRRVRAFAEAEGLLAKTDRIDAKLLRRFGLQIKPRLHVPTDPAALALRELLDYRRQISEQLVAVRNRVELAGPLLKQGLQRQIKFLEAEKAEADRLVQAQIDSDDQLRPKSERLQLLQGVGPVLAATLLAHVPELGRIESPQLVALVGVAPHPRDSGKTERRRHVRGGRMVVRNVLYMAAIAAVRYNPILGAFYKRLRQKGKPALVAIIAVMRKMLHVLNRLIADPHFTLVS